MERNPTPIAAPYVRLACNFIGQIYFERFQINVNHNEDCEQLIDGLLPKLNRKLKEDRALAKNLKALKQLLANSGSDKAYLAEMRTVLLDCGLDSSAIDAALSSNELQESLDANVAQRSYIPNQPTSIRALGLESEEKPKVDPTRLKDKGNTYYMAKDYKNALLCYNQILAMPNLSTDLLVKTASNQMAALISWDGSTKRMIEESLNNLEKAILLQRNSKLFYRYAQGQKWLGNLSIAAMSLTCAQSLNPNDKDIASLLANVTHEQYYHSAAEELDDRYQPKSEHQTTEKINTQFPGFDLSNFLEEALEAGFPPAFVLQGHKERDFNKNYEEAFLWYRRAATAGNAEGMLNLSDFYLKGLAVAQDVYKAVELLQMAVQCDPREPGVVESYNSLGKKYLRGTGVEQDFERASYWFKKCADLGFAEGELDLGHMLALQGKYAEAMELFNSAAVKGCARAYASLGDLYRDGLGVHKSPEKARQMYEKAKYHGFSLDVEAELKKAPLPTFEKKSHKTAKLEKIKLKMTAEALEDLEVRADESPTAQKFLIGWQNYQQGVCTLNTMTNSAHDDYILEMFSSFIQHCGHFLELTRREKEFLENILIDVTENHTIVDPIDLAVCGHFLKFTLATEPIVARENPYIASQTALELNALGEKQKAFEIINWAISKNPHHFDLRYYKARISQSLDSYLKFIQKAPQDHYWLPQAHFAVAEILMNQAKTEEALNAYKSGLMAEEKQFKLFRSIEIPEKRIVALYLISENRIPYPPFLKITNARRKELIAHQHNALKDYLHLSTPKKDVTLIRTTLNKHRRQPNPTEKSRQTELFLDDLDLSKEHIYEGYMDCLVLAPPLKNFGIVTVVEDKKGNTSRVLLYDNISLVHIKVGQWIRILNPYVRIATDQRSAIKVTNKKCFEVLHFDTICHLCAKITTPNDDLTICPGCFIPVYCSQKCLEIHQYDYQHNVVCYYLASNRQSNRQ